MNEFRFFTRYLVLVYFYTTMVFLSVYTLSSGHRQRNLKRRDLPTYVNSRIQDFMDLPSVANSFGANDIFLANYVDSRLRNVRSAITTSIPVDSSHVHFKSSISGSPSPQQRLESPEYSHHFRHQRYDEDDPSQPKFEIEMPADAVKPLDRNVVNKGSGNVTATSASPANENFDINYKQVIDAMLTILQVTPALTKEVYDCIRGSPAFQIVMNSLQNNMQTKIMTTDATP